MALPHTPGAASRFLEAGLRTRLWGMNIVHASQIINFTSVVYPHNFNIAYLWSRATSELMRDWLLLTMRQGVQTDDQSTLHLAELRQRDESRNFAYEADQLKVGRILPEYGAAFYNVVNRSSGQVRTDGARVTPVLSGRIHVLHSTNTSLCDTFNLAQDETDGSYVDDERYHGQRQMLMLTIGRVAATGLPLGRAVYRYRPMRSHGDCMTTLGGADGPRACLIGDAAFEAGPGYGTDYAVPANMEEYTGYRDSSRCGDMCK